MLVACLAHPFTLFEVGGHTNWSRMENLIFFFYLLKYHLIYAFVPICTVSVLVYPTHARCSQNALLSGSLYSDILMFKNALKCHVDKIYVFVPVGVDN
jgi:hypothetical protein